MPNLLLKRRKASSPPATAEEHPQTNYSPACPGVVKPRQQGRLSKLPSGTDAFTAFAQVRVDKDLSDEEAFLRLLSTYDVPLRSLSQIFVEKLEVSYGQVAPYVWLDPNAGGRDMKPLEVFRSRIPKDIFKDITKDVDAALILYGPLESHDNEETRSRFIASLFGRLVCLFQNTIVNKPEGLLESEFTRKGRIEHHFIAVESISIVFIEVKKVLAVGNAGLNMKAQVLAECAACDYANLKRGYWVPILAILCDGNNFEFFVYDSADKAVYSSDWRVGIVSEPQGSQLDLLLSTKKTTEYLFDWFIMAYINGIRAFFQKSHDRSRVQSKWESALISAEKALALLREADKAAANGRFEESEEMASRGAEELKSSVEQLPYQPRYQGTLGSIWDGSECLEVAFSDASAFR
ncbi:hypothetical protein V8E54_008468 [Elaphomyces granulatus]